MLGFRQFIREYLTQKQREQFAGVEMTGEARQATDHFFGEGNDLIKEPIKGYEGDKSEVHKAIERHTGRTFSVNDYKAGMVRDEYGKKVTIPSLITDKQLKHQFNQDNTRTGKGMGHTHYMTIVRGTEVAGQTNSEPDPQHPRGHSWGESSCKNIESGCNRHYLSNEIKHGTVVVRAHDHTGQEVYRATLQPHHSDYGDTAYVLDSEYGLKHPLFTAHARDVAKRLSGEYKPGIYMKHEEVYNDSGHVYAIHPRATSEQIHKEITTRLDPARFKAAVNHPNTSSDVLSHIADSHDSRFQHSARLIHSAIARHPNLTSEHVNRLLANPKVHSYAVEAVLDRPDLDESNISAALRHESSTLRLGAIGHAKVNSQHITDALHDENFSVRTAAINHPKVQSHHIDIALNDKVPAIRATAMMHSNLLKPHHLDKAVNDSDASVVIPAITHRLTQPHHIDAALNSPHYNVIMTALGHPDYIKPHHIDKALDHPDTSVRMAALDHSTAVQPHHIDKVLDDPRSPDIVQVRALNHPTAVQLPHIQKGLASSSSRVRNAAQQRADEMGIQ